MVGPTFQFSYVAYERTNEPTNRLTDGIAFHPLSGRDDDKLAALGYRKAQTSTIAAHKPFSIESSSMKLHAIFYNFPYSTMIKIQLKRFLDSDRDPRISTKLKLGGCHPAPRKFTFVDNFLGYEQNSYRTVLISRKGKKNSSICIGTTCKI